MTKLLDMQGRDYLHVFAPSPLVVRHSGRVGVRLRNKMKKLTLLFCFSWIFASAFAQQSELDELFQAALNQNRSLKNSTLQRDLARVTTKIAGLNAFTPRIPVSYQALDNVALQKTYVPGVIFGQPEGTFKELVMGQKYVATFNISPQFDILNFGNQAQKKAAVLNEQSANLNERQAQRDIYLQINSAYHNILSFNAQKVVLDENLKTATKITEVIKNRQQEGVARNQEVNEAEVNVITIQDKIFQLNQNIQLQYEMLKVLTGTENLESIKAQIDLQNMPTESQKASSSLDFSLAELRRKTAVQDVFSAKRDQWPVLSFVSSFNWQNLNNSFFYGSGSNPIYFAYMGLKLSWDLPTNVQKISNLKNREIQLKIAENTVKQVEEQQYLADTQRDIEWVKAKGQWEALKKIETLRKDTFAKNFAQFEEEILSLDKLLISQNDLLLSQLNLASAAATVKYNAQVIRINNLY